MYHLNANWWKYHLRWQHSFVSKQKCISFYVFSFTFFYSLTIKWLKPWLTLNGFCIFPLILMIKPFLLYFSFILFFFTKMMLHQLFYFLVFKMIYLKNKMFILFYLPFFNFHTWITWNVMTKFSIFFFLKTFIIIYLSCI